MVLERFATYRPHGEQAGLQQRRTDLATILYITGRLVGEDFAGSIARSTRVRLESSELAFVLSNGKDKTSDPTDNIAQLRQTWHLPTSKAASAES